MFNCCMMLKLCAIVLINQSINSLINAQSSSSTGSFVGPLPVIERVTGCVDRWTTTVECSRPTHLTLHGSGFMNGLEDERDPTRSLVVTIGPPGPSLACSVDRFHPLNDTYMECDIYNVDWGVLPTNQMISMTLYNKVTYQTSLPVPAFSMEYEATPIVTGVVGCRSSPNSFTTTGCDLVNDQITIIGSGFMNLHQQVAVFTLGSSSVRVSLAVEFNFITSYTNTSIVMSFARNHLLLSVGAQRGELQQITIVTESSVVWTSTPIYIQFVNLPQPTITSIEPYKWSPGCNLAAPTNQSIVPRFRDCVAGLSTLKVIGTYLFRGSSFFVGGVATEPLAPSKYHFDYVDVVMPIHEFQEGVFYAMSVLTASGTSSYGDSVLEFNTDPIITSVTPCVQPGLEYAYPTPIRCMAGDKLYMTVLNVKQTTSPRVMMKLTSAEYQGQTIECDGATRIDSRSLYCIMPAQPTPSVWQNTDAEIHVTWASHENTTSVTVGSVFEDSQAPRITSITGCYSNSGDPLYLNQCLTNSSVVTMTGVRLGQPSNGRIWQIRLGPQKVTIVNYVIVDSQTIVMTVPALKMMGTLLTNEMYQIDMIASSADMRQLRSNFMYVTFVSQESRDPISTSTSSNTVTIAVATVFSVLGAVLILVVLVYMMRKSPQKQNLSQMEMNSSGSNHVELSEV